MQPLDYQCYKSKSCIHDGFILFQPKDDSILPEFLYYLLKYKEKYFNQRGRWELKEIRIQQLLEIPKSLKFLK